MTPPSIVLDLAEKEGKTPLDWFVADDHVTIVYASGEKIRYERESCRGRPCPASKKLPADTPTCECLRNCRRANQRSEHPSLPVVR